MKNSCFAFLFIFTILSCNTSKTNTLELIDFAPKNASYIVTVNNIENFKSSLNNTHFIQTLSNTATYKKLEQQLQPLSLLNIKTDALICFFKDEKDSLQFSIITKYNDALFVSDSILKHTTETIQFKNKSITKLKTKTQILYSAIINSVCVASSSKQFIEQSFNVKKNINLENAYKILDKNKSFSIIANTNYTDLNSFFPNNSLSLKTLSNSVFVDVDMHQNEILINGIAKATDSTKNLITVFKNTSAQENLMAQITPSNANGFLSFTFDDFSEFEKNLRTFNKTDSTKIETTLFNNITEVGVIYSEKNKTIVLNSIDAVSTKNALDNNRNLVETYRGIEIYNFNKPKLFASLLSPFITFTKANLYCTFNHFFLFANTIDELQNSIANYQNKTTLANRDYFKAIQQNLSSESSLLVVANSSKLKSVLSTNLQEQLANNFGAYKTSALQFIYDTNFAHINAVIKKAKTKATENSITEEFSLKLDTPLRNNPQFVTNHITKQKEIVVQDINNNLYLISNRGKVLFKKQLHGAILGKIEQIDIYKNGRLQLAFATPKRMYVLDRNGKNVAPFPLKFKAPITQPLAVFNYDKNKNYRLLITQGKTILMYNTKGKIVKGFTFKQAKNTIISKPKHFRILSKDYLVFKTEKKLYILDRKGNTRVTPKQQKTYSNKAVYLYKNAFTTTGKNGTLITVNTKGNTTSTNLNLLPKHGIAATLKTLVTQTENRLSIKGKTTDLDFGNYCPPKLFYLNNKIYVSVTDLQSQKIYLFDSQSKLLPNFPIYGNSAIELANADRDKNLEFVTKGELNSIILYQIN